MLEKVCALSMTFQNPCFGERLGKPPGGSVRSRAPPQSRTRFLPIASPLCQSEESSLRRGRPARRAARPAPPLPAPRCASAAPWPATLAPAGAPAGLRRQLNRYYTAGNPLCAAVQHCAHSSIFKLFAGGPIIMLLTCLYPEMLSRQCAMDGLPMCYN